MNAIGLRITALVLCLGVFTVPAKELLCQTKTNEIKEATVTYKRSSTQTQATKNQTTQTSHPPTTQAMSTKETPKPAGEKMDTIIKLGGKRIICQVKKVNPTTVTYSLPNSNVQLDILRKDIEKIIYKTGKVDIFNKPIFSVVDKLDWQAVMITENPADVTGLYQRGVIKANASSGSRSPKAAKQSAMIRLQKKAANMGALIVLLVRSEMKGGYGEIPGWELEGIAYSDTPPTDTAAVNKAIRELIERTNQNKNKAGQ
ncbi:MAG TPA: hypothetical protein PLD12_02005 [Bacteroidales bacterium]|nr:hypothetical protein [Bacteroidales bacterium]HPO64653.1 hypothetical protein [Bacteroidales bacterium]